jgi:chemosensory pili system protein ChpA (sensor histidine kinase/response regulator)
LTPTFSKFSSRKPLISPPELDEALTGWQSEPTNMMHADQLKRVLHTLKGGARLAGLKRLGDVSHDFETRVIELGPRAPDAAFFASMMSFYDEISSQVDRVRAGGAAAAVAANLEAVAKASAATAAAAPVVVAPVVAEAPVVADAPVVLQPAAPVAPLVPMPKALVPAEPQTPKRDAQTLEHRRAPGQTAARQAQPQEMVKVPSDLLEKLVNLAGETSINRSRIEQQVTDFRFTISEMGSTISTSCRAIAPPERRGRRAGEGELGSRPRRRKIFRRL